MSTQTLVATDILADLEAFYSNPPATHALTLEEQAQCYALIWELHGHLAMLRTTKPVGNAANAVQNLAAVARELLGLLANNDDALDRAHEMVDAMPAGARKQALTMHLEQRFLSRREMGGAK